MIVNRFSILFFYLPFLAMSQRPINNCEEIVNKGPYLSRAASISLTDDSLLYDTRVLQHCFGADSIDIQILEPLTVAGLTYELFDRESWTYTDLWNEFLLYKKSDEYKKERGNIVRETTVKQTNVEATNYQFPGIEISFKELTTLEAAVNEAKKQQKPILIYFTAYACANCRRFESRIFSNKTVQQTIVSNYLTFAGYCDDKSLLPDGITVKGDKNTLIQITNFKSIALPAFYIVKPDGTVLDALYYTQDTEEFLNFLKQ